MSWREEVNQQAEDLSEWIIAEVIRLADLLKDEIDGQDVWIFEEPAPAAPVEEEVASARYERP